MIKAWGEGETFGQHGIFRLVMTLSQLCRHNGFRPNDMTPGNPKNASLWISNVAK
jgi:hypothetical protein